MRMIYDKLFRVLQERNIDYNELLHGSGISLLTLSKIVHGQNLDKNSILNICKFLELSPNQIIEIVDEPEIKTSPKRQRHFGKVYQFNRHGKLIRSFNSVREAGRAVKGDPSAISKCLSGERKTAYNFIWKRNYQK